jgi:hypothetical protein
VRQADRQTDRQTRITRMGYLENAQDLHWILFENMSEKDHLTES